MPGYFCRADFQSVLPGRSRHRSGTLDGLFSSSVFINQQENERYTLRVAAMIRISLLTLLLAALPLSAAAPPVKPKPNRLARESSPYLLQHAHNPVNWYPWGEEAFARAKKEGKLVFLSIGYSSCHWCHVMEKES